MLEDITKEELVIYNYVSDKLDNYINQNGIDNQNIIGYNNELYSKILFGSLLLVILIFIWWFNQTNKNSIQTIEQNDKKNINQKCYGGFCFRTL